MKGLNEMSFWAQKCLFVGLILVVLVAVSEASRPFSIFNLQREQEQGFEGVLNAKILSGLGIECKCCDGIGGKCSTEFTTSCSNLHCSPWKQY